MVHRFALRSLLAIAALAGAAASATAGPWLPAPGEYQSEFRASYLRTDSYRNDDGDRVPLGAVVERRDLLSWNELGWRPWASVILAVPATSLTLRESAGPLERTETGLSDLVLGVRVRLVEGATALALEADWKAPLGYDRTLEPALGDGQQDLTGALHFGAALPAVQGFVQLAGGYRHRMEDPADAIVLGADLGVWLGGALLVAGRYDGLLAAGEGETALDETDAHRVGPQIVWRLDDTLDLFAGSEHTAAGRNVLHADRFYVGLAAKRTRLDRLQGFLGGARRP